MITAIEICYENKIKELEGTICCLKEDISTLKTKLETYNNVVIERDNLRELVMNFQKWKENNNYENMKIFNELLTTCNAQTEKLKKSKTAECKCEAKYNQLRNVNSCVTGHVKSLKANEHKLLCNLADTENELKMVRRELCCTRSDLEEANCLNQTLKENLNTTEQRLRRVLRQYEDCREECNKLNEENRVLKTDLNCVKIKLDNAILSLTRAEEKFKFEREILTKEFQNKCKTLNCLELENDEINRKLKEEKCNVKKLVLALEELKNVSVKNDNELNCMIQKLKAEISTKEEQLCCLKRQINQLQQENNFCVMEVNNQNDKLRDKECQLKQVKLLSNKIGQIKREIEINNMIC